MLDVEKMLADANLDPALGEVINDVLDYIAHGDKPVGAALIDFIVTFFAEYTVDLEIIDQVVAAASTIKYDQADNSTGLTSSNAEVNDLIAKLDAILSSGILTTLGVLEEGKTLKSLVTDLIYSDAIADAIIPALVNAFAGMEVKDEETGEVSMGSLEDTLAMIGDIIGIEINLGVDAWAKGSGAFAAIIGTATTWTEVKAKIDALKNADGKYELKIGLDTKAEFIGLIDEIAAPFAPVINLLFLEDQKLTAFGPDGVALSMGSAYNYVLIPLFEALGITTVVKPDVENGVSCVVALLTTVLDYVEALLTSNTVHGAVNLLGNLANFVANDGLTVFVSNLIAPINELLVKIGAIVPLTAKVDLEKLDLAGLIGGTEEGEEAAPIFAYDEEAKALTILDGVIAVQAGTGVAADATLGLDLDLSDVVLEGLIDQLVEDVLPTLVEGLNLKIDLDFSKLAAEALTGATWLGTAVEVKDGDTKHSDGTAYSADNTFNSIGVYDINEANLLVSLLTMIVTSDNINAILDMIDVDAMIAEMEDGMVKDILTDVISYLETNAKDTLVYGLVDLLVGLIAENYVDFIIVENTAVTGKQNVTYSSELTKDDVTSALSKLATVLNNALPVFDINLSTLVSDNLYTGEMLATIVNALAGLFAGMETTAYTYSVVEDGETVEKTAYAKDGKYYSDEACTTELGADVTVTETITMGSVDGILDTVADLVSIGDKPLNIDLGVQAWADTAILGAIIGDAKSWKDVSFTETSFGEVDKAKFINVIADLVAPFDAVLGLLFDGGAVKTSGTYGNSLNAVDAVTVNFGSGYNYAILPLLEGLGIKGLMTQDEYREYSEDNGYIKYILEAVLGYVDTVLADPINGAMALVGNLAYFLANDGLSAFVTNLIAPINTLIKAIDSIIPVAVFINLEGLNFTNEVNAETGKKEFKVDASELLKLYIAVDHEGIPAGLSVNLNAATVQALVDKLLTALELDLNINLDFAKIAAQAAAVDADGKISVEASKLDSKWDNATPADGESLGVLNVDSADMLMALLQMVLTSENVEAILGMLNVDLEQLITDANLGDDVTPILIDAINRAVEDPMNLIAVVVKIINGEFSVNGTEFVLKFVGNKEYDYNGHYTTTNGYAEGEWETLANGDIAALDRIIVKFVPTLLDMLAEGENAAQILKDLAALEAGEGQNNITVILDYFLGEYVIKNDTVDMVVGALVPVLAGLDADTMDIIKSAVGLDLAPTSWAGEGTFGKFVGEAKTWAEVRDAHFTATTEGETTTYKFNGYDWKVTDTDTLLAIFEELLNPVSYVLDFVLTGGSITVFGTIDENGVMADDGITLTGIKLYDNVLAPLATALQLDLANNTVANATSAQKLIGFVKALLAYVYDDVAASPIKAVLELVGNLSFYIANNGLNNLIDNVLAIVDGLLALVSSILPAEDVDKLLSGLTKDVAIIGDIFGADGLTVAGIRNIAGNNGDGIIKILNTFIDDITIGDKQVNLANIIPETFFLDLAQVVVEEIEPDEDTLKDTDKFVTPVTDWDINEVKVLLFVLKTVLSEDTVNLIADLIGVDMTNTDDLVVGILDAIATNPNAQDGLLDIITLLLNKYLVKYELISGEELTKIELNYSAFGIITDPVAAPTEKDAVNNAIAKLDVLLANALDVFMGKDLKTIVGELLYTDSLAVMLVELLVPMLASLEAKNDAGKSTMDTIDEILVLLEDFLAFNGEALNISLHADAWAGDGVFGKFVGNAKTWTEVRDAHFTKDGDTYKLNEGTTFGIKDATTLVNFVSELLLPVDIVLEILLDGGVLAYNGTGARKGDRIEGAYGKALSVLEDINIFFGSGYNYAIIPLLEALGMTNVMTQAEYSADAAANGHLKAILTMLLGYVDTILGAPVDSVLGLLANLANFVAADGLTKIVSNLIAPINTILEMVDGVLPIAIMIDITQIGVEGGTVLNLFLGKKHTGIPTGVSIDLSAHAIEGLLNGLLDSTGLEIDLDFNKLAAQSMKSGSTPTASKVDVNYDESTGAGTLGVVEGDNADTLIALLQTVVTTENVEAILDMVKLDLSTLDPELQTVINNALNNTDALVGIVINIINGYYDVEGVDFFFKWLGDTSYDYNGQYNDWDDKANLTIKKLDTIIINLAPSLLGMFIGADAEGILAILRDAAAEEGATLVSIVDAVLNGFVFNDDMMTTIMGALVPLLAGLDADTLDLIGKLVALDLAPQTFANGALKAYIGDAKTWADVRDARFTAKTEGETTTYTPNEYKWNIDSQDDFLDVIADLLAPLSMVLDFFLKGGNLSVLESVSLKGAEGFTTVLVPLAKALGLELTATQDDTSVTMIRDLVEALLAFVRNDICKAPLNSVLTLLGNLFYFVANDGVNALVQNILAPITGLLQTAEELVDEEALNKILSGLTKDVEALKSIFGDEGLTLTGIKNIAGNRGDALVAIVNNLLAGIEITDKNGNKVELANLLPETFFLDISKIAIEELTGPAADQAWNKSTATVYETNVETWDVNVASLLMYVLQTALSDDIIELLAGLIGADLAGDDLVAEIFNTLLDSDNAQDLILDVIIGLFNGYDVAYVPVNGKLIETGTHFDKHENCEIADREDDINALTGNIDRLINKAIPEVFNLLEEMGTIDNMEAGALKDILLQIAADEDATVASALDLLLNSFVFTADIATTVGKALIGLLGSGDLAETIATILPIAKSAAGLDLAPAAFVRANGGAFSTFIKKAIGDKTDATWADVYAYGEANGYDFSSVQDEKTFKALIEDIATPLSPILEFLFLGKDLKLLDYEVEGEAGVTSGITLTGVEGYDQVLMPLIDALGLYDASAADNIIISAAEAKETMNGAKFLVYFIDVLLSFVDDLAEAPVTTLLNKLAGLLYFVISDGVYMIASNLVSFVDGLLAITDSITGEEKLRLNSILEMLNLGFSLETLKISGLLEMLDGEGMLNGKLKENGITVEFIEKLVGSCGDYAIVPSLRSDATDGLYNKDGELVNVTTAGVIKTIVGTPADTLMAVLEFVCEQGTLELLFGKNVEDMSADDIMKVLIENLSDPMAEDYVVEVILKLFTKYLVEYRLVGATTPLAKEEPQFTENFSKEYLETLIGQIEEAIGSALANVEGGSLSSIVYNLLLQDSYLDEIMKLLLPLLRDNEALLTDVCGYVSAFTNLELDLSVEGFRSLARDSFFKAYLGDAKTWAEVAELHNLRTETIVDPETGEEKTITLIDAYDWNITDAKSFVDRLVDMLRPLDDVLQLLLIGGTKREAFYADGTHNGQYISVLDELNIMGGSGYNYAVLPLLEAFGIRSEAILTQDEYIARVEEDGSTLKYILYTIVEALDRVLGSTTLLQDLLGIFANLAHFISNDGLTIAVANLIAPVNELLTTVGKVFPISISIDLKNINTENEIINFALGTAKAEDVGIKIDLDGATLEALIASLLGEDSTMNISFSDIANKTVKTDANGNIVYKAVNSEIDLSYDEYTGSLYRRIEGDAADTVMYVLDLLGAGDLDLGGMDIGTIIDAVINLLANQREYTPIQNQKVNPNGEKLGATYGTYISEANVNIVVDNLDAVIFDILELAGIGTLEDLLCGMLATNANINSILNLVVGLLSDNSDLISQLPEYIGMAAGILGEENINFGPEYTGFLSLHDAETGYGFYDQLYAVSVGEGNATTGVNYKQGDVTFANALKILAKAETWADLDNTSFTNCDWGFKDGDLHGFLQVIAQVLTPLNNLLGLFLYGDPDNAIINAFDILTIAGGPGYDFAIIPLMEALDINSVPTAAQYVAMINGEAGRQVSIGGVAYRSGPTAVLGTVLTMLETLVMDLCESPTDTLLTLLPNLAYFLSNDGLSLVFQNLISPIYGVLCALNAILGLNIPTRIELEQILHDIDLGTWVLWSWLDLKIPVIDWLDFARKGAASITEKKTSRSEAAWSYSNPTLPLYYTDNVITQYIDGEYTTEGISKETKSTQTYIVADKGDMLVTLLRWVLDIFKDEHNRNALTEWLAGLFGLEAGGKEIVRFALDEMFKVTDAANVNDAIIGGIFSALVAFVAVDAIVKDRYDFVQKLLNDIFTELEKCDSDCWYANLADAMQIFTGCWKQTIGTDDDYHDTTDKVEENLSWWEKFIKAIKDFFAKIAALFKF